MGVSRIWVSSGVVCRQKKGHLGCKGMNNSFVAKNCGILFWVVPTEIEHTVLGLVLGPLVMETPVEIMASTIASHENNNVESSRRPNGYYAVAWSC